MDTKRPMHEEIPADYLNKMNAPQPTRHPVISVLRTPEFVDAAVDQARLMIHVALDEVTAQRGDGPFSNSLIGSALDALVYARTALDGRTWDEQKQAWTGEPTFAVREPAGHPGPFIGRIIADTTDLLRRFLVGERDMTLAQVHGVYLNAIGRGCDSWPTAADGARWYWEQQAWIRRQ